MKYTIARLFDALFPPHQDVQCVRHIDEARLASSLSLRVGPAPWIYTGLSYTDTDVRALIRANKFHKDERAARLLGALLADMLVSVLEEEGLVSPTLVPIPASPKRLRERGYNQVERVVSIATLGIPSFQACLRRKDRQSQLRVSRAERGKNIAGAFFVPEGVSVPESIILVDDVSESGATLRDARRALMDAGAVRVVGVALAH